MMPEIGTAVALLGFLFTLIIITNYLHRHHHWSSEKSRKFLHVTGGILCLSALQFIKWHWTVLILCGMVFTILLITFINKSMPSVHGTKRISYGSLLFPIPVYICFLASRQWNNDLFFYLPISVLTFSDPLAEWGGNKWGCSTVSFFNSQKTLAGSVCFALSSFFITLILLHNFANFSLPLLLTFGLLLMLATTLAELLGLKGFDNLTIPASALLTLYLIL